MRSGGPSGKRGSVCLCLSTLGSLRVAAVTKGAHIEQICVASKGAGTWASEPQDANPYKR